jgi:hypothetical protein
MTIGRKATDSVQADYRELPDGFMGRFLIGTPKLRQMTGQYGQFWLVDFPLSLNEDEKARVIDMLGEPENGQYQSYRPAFGGYSCGYKFGGFDKTGKYESKPMIDFLSAAFGAKNQRDFRKYIEAGGGPTEDPNGTEEENQAICESWLAWVDGLEVYGTIVHEEGKRGLLARFGAPMAVGSLPNQPEPDYQAMGKGRLRAMMAETSPTTDAEKGVAAGAEISAAYSASGEPLSEAADEDEEEAQLKAKLAEKQRERLAAKAEGARQPEPAGVGAKEAPARTYESVFGEIKED